MSLIRKDRKKVPLPPPHSFIFLSFFSPFLLFFNFFLIKYLLSLFTLYMSHTYFSFCLLSRLPYLLFLRPPCDSRPSIPTHTSNILFIIGEGIITANVPLSNMSNPHHHSQRALNKEVRQETDKEMSRQVPRRTRGIKILENMSLNKGHVTMNEETDNGLVYIMWR